MPPRKKPKKEVLKLKEFGEDFHSIDPENVKQSVEVPVKEKPKKEQEKIEYLGIKKPKHIKKKKKTSKSLQYMWNTKSRNSNRRRHRPRQIIIAGKII